MTPHVRRVDLSAGFSHTDLQEQTPPEQNLDKADVLNIEHNVLLGKSSPHPPPSRKTNTGLMMEAQAVPRGSVDSFRSEQEVLMPN